MGRRRPAGRVRPGPAAVPGLRPAGLLRRGPGPTPVRPARRPAVRQPARWSAARRAAARHRAVRQRRLGHRWAVAHPVPRQPRGPVRQQAAGYQGEQPDSTAPRTPTRRRNRPPAAAPTPSRRPTGPGPDQARPPSSRAATMTTTPTRPAAGAAGRTGGAGAARTRSRDGIACLVVVLVFGGGRGHRLLRPAVLPGSFRRGPGLLGDGNGQQISVRIPKGASGFQMGNILEKRPASSRASTPSWPRRTATRRARHPGRRVHAGEGDVGRERGQADARP
ncbi:hypothetical protein SGLAM104S_02659 [Streptomyces glaucescens]